MLHSLTPFHLIFHRNSLLMRSLRAPEPLIALYLSTVAKVKAATKVTSVADLKEKHAFLDYCKVERSKLIAADPGLSQYKERKLLKDQWVKLDEAVKKVYVESAKLKILGKKVARVKPDPSQYKSGYLLFSSEVRPSVQSENAETKPKDILKILGDRWKSLSPQQREEYNARIVKKAKTEKLLVKADHSKLRSGYLLFLNETRPQIQSENPDTKPTDMIKLLAEKWKSLSPKQKDEYKSRITPKKTEAKEAPLRSAYTLFRREKLPALKSQHPEKSPGELQQLLNSQWAGLTEDEKKDYKDRFELLSVSTSSINKPAVGGWSVYREELKSKLSGPGQPQINASQFKVLLAQGWKSLSAAQKEDYNQRAVAHSEPVEFAPKPAVEASKGFKKFAGKRTKELLSANHGANMAEIISQVARDWTALTKDEKNVRYDQ